MKKILFLGAGASLAARGNFKVKPPLGKELLNRIKNNLVESWEWSGFLNKVQFFETHCKEAQVILERATCNNFEEFMASLERDDAIIIHKALQVCLSDVSSCSGLDFGFNRAADLYDDLIESLDFTNDEWSIISLNYDILFEQALERKEITYFYSHVSRTMDGVKVFKPHGSVNFMARADIEVGAGEPSNRKLTPMRLYGDSIELLAYETRNNRQLYWATDSICEPIIARYTKGKKSDFNLQMLEEIRSMALDEIKLSDEVVFIGVNPFVDGDDDSFVFECISHTYDARVVVDTCKDVHTKHEEIQPDNIICYLNLVDFLSRGQK